MRHRVTFTFQPVTVEVETYSGEDVAEELARHKLRAQIAEGSIPIWMVDCCQATVTTLPQRGHCESHACQDHTGCVCGCSACMNCV